MFEIVKRRHLRPADNLVPRTSPRPAAVGRRRCLASKNMFLAQAKNRSFLFDLCSVFAERTLIMRVIKCRKSIWWMPRR
jgi:hypothetical protein